MDKLNRSFSLILDSENEPRESGRYIKESDLLKGNLENFVYIRNDEPFPPCEKNDRWIPLP